MVVTRRDLLRLGALTAIGAGIGAGSRLVADAPDAVGRYGSLGPPDAEGIRLPPGFSARVIGRTGQPVAGTAYVWHGAPDGGACFAQLDGGWIYVSNSELSNRAGGVSAVRFDAAGQIVDAYRIGVNQHRNCGGGATSWGTWLTCEEVDAGIVYECDPTRPGAGIARPRLGTFLHETAAEDPATGTIYLTEDHPVGRLYRFVPLRRGDLSAGVLQAASVAGGRVSWVDVATDRPERSAATTAFSGGEGVLIDGPTMFVTTKGDDRIWELDLLAGTIEVFYDGRATPTALRGLDQIVVHPNTRDLYVAEDGGNLELVLIVQGGELDGVIAPFVQFAGHDLSEVTGPAFSPDGTRLYLSSQRGSDGVTGLTVEITGPFERWPETATVSGRHRAVRGPAVPAG